MKQLLLFIMCITVSLMAEAAKVSRYTGSRIFWDSRSPVTVFQGGGYARVMELQDGRLMACCESGGIKVALSSTKGRTWGTPRLIAPNSNNTPNCVPDMIQLKDGTIIVAYNPRPSQPYTPDRRFGIRLRRSTDNGATWSDEVFVFDADYTFENGCWEPALLELPSGELQLYFADESPYTTNGDQQISVCRSWDGGLTWSEPACVSYRSGHRDGMPVPVLLKDGRTIAVAIEDNGMGYGDFVPAIVQTTTTYNWRTYVDGASNSRHLAVDYNYCPVAKGGAPYLRVLPSGETVLSHQSPYNHGEKQTMYVYVGTQRAANFKAMSTPFRVPETEAALWNSLAVVDTGVVVAVGGIDGKVKIVKGYAKTQFEAPYGHPKVDGRKDTGEGYYTAQHNQIMMGSETGTYTYADLAYDDDSLYLFFQVYDTKIVTGNDGDHITLALESAGASYNTPQTTSFRYTFVPTVSQITAHQGDGKAWTMRTTTDARVAHKKYSQYYHTEVAIPWSDMGLSLPPVGTVMSINIEISNSDGRTQTTERIPDAKPDEPATWMRLHCQGNPNADALVAPQAASCSATMRISKTEGGARVESLQGLAQLTVYNLSGQTVCHLHPSGCHTASLPLKRGTYVVKARLIDGKEATQTIRI